MMLGGIVYCLLIERGFLFEIMKYWIILIKRKFVNEEFTKFNRYVTILMELLCRPIMTFRKIYGKVPCSLECKLKVIH